MMQRREESSRNGSPTAVATATFPTKYNYNPVHTQFEVFTLEHLHACEFFKFFFCILFSFTFLFMSFSLNF